MRKLAGFALPFAAAVFAAVYLASPEALPYCALACGAAALLSLCWKDERRARVLLAALGLCAGFLWTWGHDAVFLTPARLLDGETRAVSATVSGWPRATERGTAVAALLHLEGAPDVRIILYADGDHTGLKPGDGLTCTARLRRSDVLHGENTEYYRSRGISLLAYADGPLDAVPASAVPARWWPLVFSKALKERVEACFPADTAGFMTALLTGDKSALPDGLYSAFQRTGIAHVVAVSGLHISFLAGLLTTLFGKRRRLSAGLTLAVLLFFAAAAGNSPSVLRAVYLQGALLLAPLLGRENDKLTSLSAALLLLLLWNPRAAAGVSLQLSFAAVAGVYLLTGPLYEKWTAGLAGKDGGLPRRLGNKALRFLAGTLCTTLGAMVFTTPLTAYYFGAISLISPAANLLTLWAASDGFMLGLLTALLGLALPGAAGILAQAPALLLRLVQWVARGLAGLPFAAVPSGGYLGLWLGFSYLLLVLWLLWRGEKKRPLVPVCACAATLLAALAFNAAALHGGDLRVTVLDVGQGQSVVLASGGAAALVDCGGTGAADPGDVAADYIQSMGTSRLDLLILTHYHADHANGVAELMARLEVRNVLLPDVEPDDALRGEILNLALEEGAAVVFVTEDVTLPLGEAALNVYAPLGDGGANEEGLSVLCTAGDFDALITGDMNAAVEKRLVKYGNLPDIELFVAGHHGSAHSNSEELLLAVRPEYAVISAGAGNRYGHPAPEALERLAAAGCEIYRTDLMGTVSVTADTGP